MEWAPFDATDADDSFDPKAYIDRACGCLCSHWFIAEIFSGAGYKVQQITRLPHPVNPPSMTTWRSYIICREGVVGPDLQRVEPSCGIRECKLPGWAPMASDASLAAIATSSSSWKPPPTPPTRPGLPSARTTLLAVHRNSTTQRRQISPRAFTACAQPGLASKRGFAKDFAAALWPELATDRLLTLTDKKTSF